jgi:hypothetical protein
LGAFLEASFKAEVVRPARPEPSHEFFRRLAQCGNCRPQTATASIPDSLKLSYSWTAGKAAVLAESENEDGNAWDSSEPCANEFTDECQQVLESLIARCLARQSSSVFLFG